MDSGATGLLESVTHKTLHAQNFSRSSSQASHVLTELLSRYISLLAETCTRYAEHAGRASVSISDAVLALDELGISVDELSDYTEGEGRDLARYAGSTSRRAEELALLKDLLAEGRRQEHDDAITLVYAEIPTTNGVVDNEDEDDEVEAKVNGDVPVWNGNGKDLRKTLTTLPPSPISNPSSPARKRLRLASWNAPSHIPDFLPPYPTTSHSDVSPARSSSPQIKTEIEMMLPPPASASERERDRLPTPPPQQLSIATSAADYLTPVTYSMSSLSAVPASHLPDKHNTKSSLSVHGQALQLQKRKRETPAITPALFTAYHHVLTHPPPPHPSTNPARHRVALAMLAQAYNAPRWTAADTLFANAAAPRPRVVALAPTFPVSMGVGKGKEEQPPIVPPLSLRPVMANETVVPLSHQPMSRIPEIARAILPLSVFNRATRIIPPPPLVNSTSKEKFLYGMGMPAPWNANPLNQPAGAAPPAQAKGKGKDAKGKADGGDDRDHDRDRDQTANVLADATLFATWDWEAHDFRTPLPPNKRGRAFGNFNLGSIGGAGDADGGMVEMGGPSRKNSKVGRDEKGK